MKTRRYILIAIILLLAVFNFIRSRRARQPESTPVSVHVASSAHTPEAQAAWTAYDHAASLRDAQGDTFHTALEAFNTAKASVQNTPGNYDAQDLSSCSIWLLQYRSGGQSMHTMAQGHVDSCTKLHRDVAQ